jgi:hypothetical protein
MTDLPEPGAPPAADVPGLPAPAGTAARRPIIERIGMAAIAAFMAVTFGGVAAVCFASGEPFLGIMAALGTLMTAWAGLMTLIRS